MGVTRREITVLIIIIVVVVAGALIYKRYQKAPVVTTPVTTPNPQTVKTIENKFRVQIPDNAERIDLTDVSGGNNLGLATKEVKDNRTVLTVLADLPDPAKNAYYQVWLDKDNKPVVLGKMVIAKGGFLLDAVIPNKYLDYKKIIVVLGKTHLLEGTFN